MEQLISKFDSYWDLDIPEQEAFLEELLAAANKNPEGFKKLVRAASFDRLESPLPIIYECLANDTDNWGDFFIEEARRIIQLAEQSSNPKEYLYVLHEFSYIEIEHFQQRGELLEIAFGLSSDKNPVCRYYSLMLLGDFYAEPASEKHRSQLLAFLDDADWIIRYWAHITAEHCNILPEGRKPTFMERLKGKFLNVGKYG